MDVPGARAPPHRERALELRPRRAGVLQGSVRMTDRQRRRLLLTVGSLPLLGWAPAGRQQDRKLFATERKPAASGDRVSLLRAPRRALVIGNSSYGFAPLKNPANDAKAIGQELKRIGFDVVAGLDLPREE